MRFVYIKSGLRLLADTLAPIGITELPRFPVPCEAWAINVGFVSEAVRRQGWLPAATSGSESGEREED